MSGLESEQSAAHRNNQTGQGLKILTLTRLPITLAQLQAGKKSQKLKNETRQLLNSLYCSKIKKRKKIKTLYKNLINTI